MQLEHGGLDSNGLTIRKVVYCASMQIHADGSVTLTAEEARWLNDNFLGGKHRVHWSVLQGHYRILDSEGDECGWGRINGDAAARHEEFMDKFTALPD